MKRFFNLKFLLAVALGAGAVVLVSAFSSQDEFEGDHLYGDPDGEVTKEEAPSFVD